MVPPWSRPLLTLGIVLLLAGCAARLAATGQGPEPAAEPKVSGASSAAVAAATLPLDAYVPTDDQMELLNRARGLLVRDCMRRLGFADWQPPDPRVAPTPPPPRAVWVGAPGNPRPGPHHPPPWAPGWGRRSPRAGAGRARASCATTRGCAGAWSAPASPDRSAR